MTRFASLASPDVCTYQYDESSGYYYDPSTGLYYDANSQVGCLFIETKNCFYFDELLQIISWLINIIK